MSLRREFAVGKMSHLCHLLGHTVFMLAKLSLVLTLIVSLLVVTQAQPMTSPVEMKQGGGCVKMQCARGCCANVACCTVTEQQQTPRTPVSGAHPVDIQLATIGLRAYTLLFLPPAPRRPFVILDEVGTAHTLSPLAVSCIQLI